MDTTPPPLPVPSPSASTPAFKDARSGLVVFGIFAIIIGGLAALMVPFSLVGQLMVAKQKGHDLDWALLAPAMLTMLFGAIGFIWLGIGSIRARRWARALLLCLSAMGLCVGVISLMVVIPSLDLVDETFRQQNTQLPPAALVVTKVVMVATSVFTYIVIPGAFFLFYRRRNVKLTCEARDPVVRWTDRCPLPVLAVCLLQAYTTVSLVLAPRYWTAFPFAGHFVTGWPANVAWLGIAAFALYVGWGFYHLSQRAWWTNLIAIMVLATSAILTFWRADLMAYYRAAGIPDWEIEQLSRSALVHSHLFVWLSLVGAVFYLAYLLYLRRYFWPTPHAE